MIEYSEIELREMISNLKLWKVNNTLTDRTEIELTKYELLLENYLQDKLIKSIKLWMI